jgi:tetrahydromethanopterin S-methyltransferase subunit D
MFGLISPLGLAVVGLYVYVGVAIGKAEVAAGAGFLTVITKAAMWPLTIWNTINKLYLTPPE